MTPYLSFEVLLLLALATWRASHMLVNEAGPGAVFETLRFRLGASTANCSQQRAENSITNVLCCADCASVWVGIGMMAAWVYAPLVVWVFALSGLSIVIGGLVHVFTQKHRRAD